jgi:hypothetical protein
LSSVLTFVEKNIEDFGRKREEAIDALLIRASQEGWMDELLLKLKAERPRLDDFGKKIDKALRKLRGTDMPGTHFEYSCFISYRHHEQNEIADKFIADLYQALRNELQLTTGSNPSEPSISGTFDNPLLARKLCRSACMVVVYTPSYFSRTHLYCARQYRAMEQLEKIRLTHLRGTVKEHGLIIPIILRGADALPAAIKSERQCYNFDRFSLASRRLAENPEFESAIKEIVNVISKRWENLESMSDDLTSGCDNFELPSEAEIQPWLNAMIQPISPFPFPRRQAW